MIMKPQDLIGKSFNLLTILESAQRKGGRSYFKCKCTCGTICTVQYSRLARGDTKSCGCLNHKRGILHPAFSGIGEISHSWWRKHVLRQTISGKWHGRHLVTVTIQEAWELFLKQEKTCALTGILLKFTSPNFENTASLDRIDSSKPYILGNIQWVHKDINLMKQVLSQERFIELCCTVSSFQSKNK